jgi:Flp pilus assembly protein CpaB
MRQQRRGDTDVAARTLTPAQALRPPRRLDARAFFGLVIAAIATLGSIAFWSSTSDSRAVLVATRDLPAGAVIGPRDLTVARVRVDDAIYRAAVPADALGGLVGKQLAAPVYANQLVSQAQLSARPALAPGQMALTIPVSAETAAGGRIRPGDHVQVLATTAKGRPESRTSVVLPRATVYDVGYDERVAVVNTSAGDTATEAPATRGSSRGLASVTLAVTQEQALELARSRWNSEIEVALLPAEPDGR